MDPRHSETVSRVFSDVLADFAFMFGDPVDPQELPALEGKGYLACLPFRGEVAGSIAFAVPESLAVEIAANTLGLERADLEASRRAEDAVKEVASVLGGHVVTAVAGPAARVDLSPPALFPLELSDWDRLRLDPSTQGFSVNDRPVLLRVQLEAGGGSR
jgi:CheY-specific phosphatase CheX